MDYKIIKPNSFCVYQGREIGIAMKGYFASTKFIETNENEFISEVGGTSFGWIDNQGQRYKDSKYSMKRPKNEEEVISALDTYPKLKKVALREGIISEQSKSKIGNIESNFQEDMINDMFNDMDPDY
jgi:hypothetical protein